MSQIHVLDSQTDVIVAVLSNREGTTVWDDVHYQQLANNKETFDFKTNPENPSVKHLRKRNRLVIPTEDGELREFIIDETIQDFDKVEVFSTAAHLELKRYRPLDPGKYNGQSLNTMMDLILAGTGWKRGETSYSGTASIEFENYVSPFQALQETAYAHGVELKFRIETVGNQVTGRYVDAVKRLGTWSGREINSGKDLINATRREVTENIATALIGVGPEKDDGSRITVESVSDDARQIWGRDGQHLWDILEVQSDNKDMTAAQIKAYTDQSLAARIASVIEYTVDGADLEYTLGLENEMIRLGDSVRIKATEYEPPLYLDARVISVETSIVDRTQKKYKLGEFIEYDEEDITKLREYFRSELAKKTNIYYGDTEPSNKSYLWIDTSVEPNIVKRYDTSESRWVKATPTEANEVGAETPEGAQEKANVAEENAKDYADLTVANLVVDTAKIKDASITTAKIGDAQVTNAKIDRASVNKLVVDTADIKDAAITTAKVGNAQITNAKIDRASVNKLVVGTADIADAAIKNAKIENGAITTAKIGDAQVTTAKIGTGAITTALIDEGAIGEAQIADASITDAKIVDLTADKLTAGTIDGSQINVTNLVADNIVAGTLTFSTPNLLQESKIVGHTVSDPYVGKYSWRTQYNDWGVSGLDIPVVSGERLTISAYVKKDPVWSNGTPRVSVTYYNSSNAQVGSTEYFSGGNYTNWTRETHTTNAAPVGAARVRVYFYHSTTGSYTRWNALMIQKGTIATAYEPHTNDLLADKGITNIQLGDSAVDNRVITANTITGDKLVVDSITGREIKSKSVTANHMVANTITAGSGVIADAAITTAKIGDAQITGAKIQDATITNAKITGLLDASKIRVGPDTSFDNGYNPKFEYMGSATKVFYNVASYSGVSGNKGVIVIDTPITFSQKMTTIDISGYNYVGGNEKIDLSIGFYAYQAGNYFVNTGYSSKGTFNFDSIQLAVNPGGTVSILLGSYSQVTQYPKIVVDKVQVGHSTPPDSWATSGWSVSTKTSLTGYTNVVPVAGTALKDSHDLTMLWRYPDTTYINGGDIYTNTITANQIATGTITAASGILADASVTTAKIGDAQITNAKIKDLDASKITAGTIGADRIGANTITADKLNVLAKNLINNPSVSGTLEGWSQSSNGTFSVTQNNNRGNVIKHTASMDSRLTTNAFEVDPNQTYKVQVSLLAPTAGGTKYFGLYCYDESGANVGCYGINAGGTTFSGTANTNPYFWSSGATFPDWHDMEAYIVGCGVTDPKDVPVGKNVTHHYRMHPKTRKVVIRVLNYYNSGTSRDIYWFAPSVIPVSAGKITANNLDITQDIDVGNRLYMNPSIASGFYEGSPKGIVYRSGVAYEVYETSAGSGVFNHIFRTPSGGRMVSTGAIQGNGNVSADGVLYSGAGSVVLGSNMDGSGTAPNVVELSASASGIKVSAPLVTDTAETGYCGVGGLDANTTGPITGTGVNFRVKKTYVPSSITLTATSSNTSNYAAIDITSNGFWLYLWGGNSTIYKYWRGNYTA